MLEKLLKRLQEMRQGYRVGSPEYDQMPYLGEPPTVLHKDNWYQGQPTPPAWETQWDRLVEQHKDDPEMLSKIKRARDIYNTNMAPILAKPFWNALAKEEWRAKAEQDPKYLKDMEDLERRGIHPFTVKSF